ncbi:MAG: hypothetical protein U1F17_11840 [Burkholderiaceae bacterium]
MKRAHRPADLEPDAQQAEADQRERCQHQQRGGGAARADSAVNTSSPLPAPPQMKLPAARQSQCACCQGFGP